MDMRPILLPLDEQHTRKARDLKKRGYTPAEIAEAMGLRETRVDALLGTAAMASQPRKPVAVERAKR